MGTRFTCFTSIKVQILTQLLRIASMSRIDKEIEAMVMLDHPTVVACMEVSNVCVCVCVCVFVCVCVLLSETSA